MMSNKGFSLISVLVALTLIAVGLSAFSMAAFRAAKLENDTTLRFHADMIAKSHIEDLLARDPGTLVSEAPVQIDMEGTVGAGPMTREVIVANAQRLDQSNNLEEQRFLRRVIVKVTTPTAGVVKLSTLVYVSGLGN